MKAIRFAHWFALVTTSLYVQWSFAANHESIVLQLNWHHQFQFAGYYAAIEQGYYQKAGLDVTLHEMESNIPSPVAEVLSGRANYGIGASELALLRAQGQPVVAVATIIQHSPLTLYTSRRISSAAQLNGKRIMLLPHETELFAYLNRAGVSLDTVMPLAPNFGVSDLISGKVDAISGYQTDEPFALKKAGFAFNAFSPRELGISFYGDTLFTTESEVLRHPDRLRAFRNATINGWKYALSHQSEIADLIIKKYNKNKSREHLLFEAQELQKLILPDLIEVGQMNLLRWQLIAATYADLGMLPKAGPNNGILDHASSDHSSMNSSMNSSIEGLIYEDNQPNFPKWFSETVITLFAFLLTGAFVAARLIYLNRRLKNSEERYRFIVDTSADIIWEVDSDLLVRFISPADQLLRGYHPDEVIGRPISNILTSASYQLMLDKLQQRYNDEASGIKTGALRYEIELKRKNGSTFWAEISSTPIRNEEGRIVGLRGSCRDISERKHAEEDLRGANRKLLTQLSEIHRLQHALREQAMRDPLTGMFNRRYLDETLDREIARARRESAPLSLVMLDADHFKLINDQHGHRAGDAALRALSELLRKNVRTEDVACRFGGEEFIVLLPGMPADIAFARAEAWRIEIAALQIAVKNETLKLTASFGLAVYPNDGEDADALLHAADVALYKAKHSGRNRVIVFHPTLLSELTDA